MKPRFMAIIFAALMMLRAGTCLAQEGLNAEPANDPGSWVTENDYPSDARHAGVSAIVPFRLKIDREGQPISCETLGHSESMILDKTTCILLLQRARFKPKIDTAGKAVESTFSSRIKWVVPLEALHFPTPYRAQVSFIVGTDGKVDSCELVHTDGEIPPEIAEHLTSQCKGVTFQPYRDERGQPWQRKVTVSSSVTVEPVK